MQEHVGNEVAGCYFELRFIFRHLSQKCACPEDASFFRAAPRGQVLIPTLALPIRSKLVSIGRAVRGHVLSKPQCACVVFAPPGGL